MTIPPKGPPRGLVFLLGTLAAVGPLSIDLYLPALPAIAVGLSATLEIVQYSITVFLAGFSFGMMFYGPISDRYGRRSIMLTGIALYIFASLVCMLATGAEQLIVGRFLQAIGGGAAAVLARTVIRDIYPPIEAIRRLSLMAMVTAIAPLIAPIIGSLLLGLFGWRGTFLPLVLWGAISFVMVLTQLAETHPLERRSQLSLGRAFAIYADLLFDPYAMGLIFAGGMSFAAMFTYITASPFYFIEVQHFSPTVYGLSFAANALGIFAANYANSRLVRNLGPIPMVGIGSALSVCGALILLVCIPRPDTLPWVIFGLFLVVSMTGLQGANCVGLLMARYQKNAGAAAALFGASQFGLGMWASAVVSHQQDATGQAMAWVIGLTTSLSFLGYVLFRYQHQKKPPQ